MKTKLLIAALASTVLFSCKSDKQEEPAAPKNQQLK